MTLFSCRIVFKKKRICRIYWAYVLIPKFNALNSILVQFKINSEMIFYEYITAINLRCYYLKNIQRKNIQRKTDRKI